jgi:hypothetical protein
MLLCVLRDSCQRQIFCCAYILYNVIYIHSHTRNVFSVSTVDAENGILLGRGTFHNYVTDLHDLKLSSLIRNVCDNGVFFWTLPIVSA